MTPIAAPDGLPIVIVDDVYNAAELKLIWDELDFLTSPRRLFGPEKVFAATNYNGEFKKFANGVFLDDFYSDRNVSDILTLNRKLFSDEVFEMARAISPFYKSLRSTNSDFTLINYYSNSEKYDPHVDKTVFTAVTSFYREPRGFTGGDLLFTEYDTVVECKHNRLVIFPGAFEHAITPVKMGIDVAPFGGYGRYGMAQFLTIK